MATKNRADLLTDITTNSTNLNTGGIHGTGINSNGVKGITGAMLNNVLNLTIGMLKRMEDLNDSTFNLLTDNTDDITDTATNRFVTDAQIITWDGKAESGDAVTVSLSVVPTTTTINYKDHSDVNQSVVVVTGVSVTVTSAVIA